MKEYINPNQLVRIYYIEKHETDWIKYHEPVKFLGRTFHKGGFYDGVDRLVASEKTPVFPTSLNNVYTIDFSTKKAYEKDKIVLEFSNGHNKEKYFNDKQSALKYLNIWKRKSNLI